MKKSDIIAELKARNVDHDPEASVPALAALLKDAKAKDGEGASEEKKPEEPKASETPAAPAPEEEAPTADKGFKSVKTKGKFTLFHATKDSSWMIKDTLGRKIASGSGAAKKEGVEVDETSREAAEKLLMDMNRNNPSGQA